MDFIGYTFSEIRQSLVDMDKMLQMLATPSAEDDEASAADGISHGDQAGGGTPGSRIEAGVGGGGEAAGAAAIELPWAAPPIAFRGVAYSYPNASTAALVDVSFDAPAGGVTALVGQSGSGKSTCLRLLSRLCDADSGEVRCARPRPRLALLQLASP